MSKISVISIYYYYYISVYPYVCFVYYIVLQVLSAWHLRCLNFTQVANEGKVLVP